MDQDREQERRTYQLCQMGFGALAFALVLATLSTVLALPLHFGGRAFLPALVNSELWAWLDTPIVWGSLFGTYLLWGRWSDRSWQRRTGLLLVMCMVDAMLWSFDHADTLGLHHGDVGHLWFRLTLGEALGWAEFSLLASLSSDVLVHLGVEQAAQTGRATRSLARTGAVVWMLLFLVRTDWRRGWPLVVRRFISPDMLMLCLAVEMIRTITLIQVTALAIAATRRCSSVLAEIARAERADDLFLSPSEADCGHLAGAWGKE
jgi:hypothetical protein